MTVGSNFQGGKWTLSGSLAKLKVAGSVTSAEGIAAASIGQLVVQGDYDAPLTLTGAIPRALGRATINGDAGGTWRSPAARARSASRAVGRRAADDRRGQHRLVDAGGGPRQRFPGRVRSGLRGAFPADSTDFAATLLSSIGSEGRRIAGARGLPIPRFVDNVHFSAAKMEASN